ncbi:MAG: hypothetical protein ACLUKN_03160 [Bacilli bacterium]
MVSYRTGDVMGASKHIKKAYENGDKDAATDGMELFLLSNNIDIWNTFKPYIKDVSFTPNCAQDWFNMPAAIRMLRKFSLRRCPETIPSLYIKIPLFWL